MAKSMKKYIPLLMITLMIALWGVLCNCEEVYAVEETEVMYEKVEYDMAKIPMKEGYLFAGYYVTENDEKPIVSPKEGDKLYAKYVPEYVMSVKVQNEEKVNEKGQRVVRVVSSVNGRNYKEVGFQFMTKKSNEWGYRGSGATTETGNSEITTGVYKKLREGENLVEAKDIFGKSSSHFTAMNLQISQKNENKAIYVRPYWVTMNGDCVYGVGRQVYAEDGYSNSDTISVSINKKCGDAIAAGKLEMTVPAGLELYQTSDTKDFAKSKAKLDGTTLKCIFYSDEVGKDVIANDMLTTVRFKIVDSDLYNASENKEFKIISSEFCNWSEENKNITLTGIYK